jgi:copper chaperone CopZ
MKQIARVLLLLLAVLVSPMSSGAQGSEQTLVLHVGGITCALCAKAIDRALRALPGVEHVEIDAKTEQVTVHAAPSISREQLVSAIVAAGPYRVLPTP